MAFKNKLEAKRLDYYLYNHFGVYTGISWPKEKDFIQLKRQLDSIGATICSLHVKKTLQVFGIAC